MPLPKIEQPDQIVLQDGEKPAKRLVKVVKMSKVDPALEGRVSEIIEKAKNEASKE